ncbi:hypothetical protein GCM10011514_18780 [Emticicia aquatilis]|uniref:Peptidase M12B domain-containing protein n=1 Tax=Emticicia aquatilis TaxID=1537369 RepID=A0A916YP83_9BACT|nr:M12 family metallo-peptidase [Emticicia aquatilis]GGD54851.1 hypothetical protein GCM10011514_18780 [Emticicia aquatilis]
MKFRFPSLLFLFLVSTLSFAQDITCGFNDNEISQEIMKQLPQFIKERKTRQQAIDDFYLCKVVVDVDYQTFKKYNGDTLFIKNEVATIIQKASEIYENEIATKLVLTYVNIWKEEAKDPYNNVTDIFTMLTNLRNVYTNTSLSKIPSDVVMYLNSKGFSGAGGVASGKFNVSPWQNISTIAHEIGHNFGSPHTQSCTWPGGAIDYCYAVEGSCYSDALENIKGTLMSYCGRRLNNFHPLCIELMNRTAASRFLKIRAITETVKLNENWDFNRDAYFSWNTIVNAESYLIELADGADFKNIVLRDTSEQSYAVLPYLKKNQTCFLRIKAKNRLGEGQWSNTMKMNVPAIVETPKIQSPSNGLTNVDGSTLVLRFDKIDDATEYQIQTIGFSSGNTSYSFDLNATNRRSTTNSLSLVVSNEAFTWRVRAVRGTETSAWSKPSTFWIKPNTTILDLTQQALNGYPLTFPINYSAGSGDILEVRVIVSEKSDYSSPIIQKSIKSGIYASQTNYPFLLQNLKPNTTYYVKFEEYNNEKFNIIGLPQGLVRFTERSFKTGTEAIPESFSYFNNANVENLSRTLRKVVFNDNFAFVTTNEGIVQMKLDGTSSKLLNRNVTNGNVSNVLLDSKTDVAGNLWILTQVSKRIAFDGVFPKPTFRLAKLDPNTFKILESRDFVGSNNASFSSFDPQTKFVTDNTSIQKVNQDSTDIVYQLPSGISLQQSVAWGKNSAWMLVFNSTNGTYEIYNYNFETKKAEVFNRSNSLLSSSISQIYLDSKENLWVIHSGGAPLLRYSKETGWVNQNLPLSGTNRVIGETNGKLFLYNILGTKRDLYSFSGSELKLVENIPLVSTSGTWQLDNSGKVWLLQFDKLLKINSCNYLKAPKLKASSSQILKGEQVSLTAEGCSSAKWTWTGENQAVETLITDKNNIMKVSPQANIQYKVQCLDQECISDLSNQLEINVLALSLKSFDKNQYCSNEKIDLKLSIAGKYNANNEFKIIFTGKSKYTSSIGNDPLKANIPNDIVSGKYWAKLESTDPKVSSTDSIEVHIFQAPTISLTKPAQAYVYDTVQVLVNLSGTPPYKFVINGNERITTSASTYIKKFYPTEPIYYAFSVADISDANCPNGVVLTPEESLRVTLNPKTLGFWVNYFPVPFDSELNFHVYNKPSTKLNVTLLNEKGNLITQQEYPITTYFDKFKLSLPDLNAGIYFLILETGKRREVKKIVKW